jgi:hypothetical protein
MKKRGKSAFCNHLSRFNLLPNLNFKVVAFSMCVPSRLGSIERLGSQSL